MEAALLLLGAGVVLYLTRKEIQPTVETTDFDVQTLDPQWWHSATADRLGLDNVPDA